ncbi:ABC transporter permease [Mesorhizobium sp. CAU 1741]|uniref:ABC transporter permease n=1 Tax=Mesorhizobium sp. CAU 1741 TaxID=3140366 RepID=UPI00325C20D1
MMRLYEQFQDLVLGVASLLVLVVVWQLVVELGLVNPFFVSKPTLVATEMASQLNSGILLRHTVATLHALVLSFGLAAGVGIGLGLLAGWFRDVESALDPFIWFKYSAPTIAFYPLFIAWLGYGLPTIVAIAFLFALTPIYANTVSAIRNVDANLVRAARSFGARPHDIFLRVAIPGSIPMIVAGLRLGVGRALTGVVVAELFGSTEGLGYAVGFYGQKLQTTPMMVIIVVVVILGVLLTQLLSRFEAATSFWRTGS